MATHSSVLTWRIPGTAEPWWAAVYGVAQSRTRLKRPSSSILPLKIALETACWDSVSRVAGLSVPAGAGVAAHAEFQGACPLGSEPASQFQAQCWTPGPCWELPCQEQPGGWYHSFTVWDGGRSGGVASQKRKPTSGPKLPWSPCAACDSGSTGQGFLSPKERQVACPSPGSI